MTVRGLAVAVEFTAWVFSRSIPVGFAVVLLVLLLERLWPLVLRRAFGGRAAANLGFGAASIVFVGASGSGAAGSVILSGGIRRSVTVD